MHHPEDRASRSLDAMITSLVSLQKVIVSDTEELTGDNKIKFITSMLKTVSNKQDMDMDDMDTRELMEFLDFMESMSGVGSGKNSRTKNKNRR